jgi:hypothetical protein
VENVRGDASRKWERVQKYGFEAAEWGYRGMLRKADSLRARDGPVVARKGVSHLVLVVVRDVLMLGRCRVVGIQIVREAT